MLMKHQTSGNVYRVQMLATEEATMEPVVVYSCATTGMLWTRPAKEFFDGRFRVYVGATEDDDFQGVLN